MDRPTQTAAERVIRAAIGAGGPLTFAAFMDLALHGPGGYYDAAAVVGEQGDFFTSPEVHPGFGACIGVQAHALWAALGRPARFDIVEVGGGSGALARDLLGWARAAQPDFAAAIRYRIVERSAHLIARQRAALAGAGLDAQRVEWLDQSALDVTLPPLDGLVIAHEFLDALPFHRVTRQGGVLRELCVALRDDALALEPGEPSDPAVAAYLARLGVALPEGGLAEICLLAEAWLRRTAAGLGRGAILVVDYGHEADALYERAGPRGTLRCYYRHTVNDDPLAHIGRQDMTADVDFSTLRLVGVELGLDAYGPLAQAPALDLLGLSALGRAIRRAPVPWAEQEANVRAIRELSDPDGLGGIGWLLLTRGVEDFLPFRPAEPPRWSPPPLLAPDQFRLLGPEALEGFGNIEAQWRELWEPSDGGDADDDDAEDTLAGARP